MMSARRYAQLGVLTPFLVLFIALIGVGVIALTTTGKNPLKLLPINHKESNPLKQDSFVTDSYIISLRYDKQESPILHVTEVTKASIITPVKPPTMKDDYSLNVFDDKKKLLGSFPFYIPDETLDPGSLLNGNGTGTIIKLDKVNFDVKVPALPKASSFEIVAANGDKITDGTLALTSSINRPLAMQTGDKRVLAEKDCSKATDVCASLKADKTSVKVGESITLSWKAVNVGAKGAVALNGPMIERFVQSEGKLTVFMPKPGAYEYKVKADTGARNGDGSTPASAMSTDTIIINVAATTEKYLSIAIMGNGYTSQPNNGGKLMEETFDKDVMRIKEGLLGFEPFTSSKSKIRFYPIDTPVDGEKKYDFGCAHDTKFPAYLSCSKAKEAQAIASGYLNDINTSRIAIMANDQVFGGSLGYLSEKNIAFAIDKSTNYFTHDVISIYNGPWAPALFTHGLGIKLELVPEVVLMKDGAPIKVGLDEEASSLQRNCLLVGRTENSATPAIWTKLGVIGVMNSESTKGCYASNWWRSQNKSIMNDLHSTEFSPAAIKHLTGVLTQLLTSAPPAMPSPSSSVNPSTSPVSTPRSSASTAPTQGSVTASTTICPNDDTAPALVAAAKLVLEKSNEERAKAGLPALIWDDALAKGAVIHSKDMRDHNFIGHQSSKNPSNDPTAVFARIAEDSGVQYANAENAAGSSNTVDGVMKQWLNSSGHKQNILAGTAGHLGVGVACKSGSGYWTQIFGPIVKR